MAGNSGYNGLNLTSGARFGFYAAEARGIRKSTVAITDAGGQTLDQYWEDGPQLTGWGGVVAKYVAEITRTIRGIPVEPMPLGYALRYRSKYV